MVDELQLVHSVEQGHALELVKRGEQAVDGEGRLVHPQD